MDSKDIKIKYDFSFINEVGAEYHVGATKTIYPDVGYSEKEVLEEGINNFLKVIELGGENDYVLLESLTVDEYQYLLDQLETFRANNADVRDYRLLAENMTRFAENYL
jgi:hypothetical protein